MRVPRLLPRGFSSTTLTTSKSWEEIPEWRSCNNAGDLSAAQMIWKTCASGLTPPYWLKARYVILLAGAMEMETEMEMESGRHVLD